MVAGSGRAKLDEEEIELDVWERYLAWIQAIKIAVPSLNSKLRAATG